jgi:predicted permease
VVISHAFWTRRLGARLDVVGDTIRVNDRQAVVVGIVAAEFPDVGMDMPSIWMPIAQAAAFVPGSRIGKDWSTAGEMFARVRPGVSRDTVRTSLKSVIAGLREQEPTRVEAGQWLEPAPGTARFLSPREAQQVWAVVTAVTVLAILVLMIACLNLSNLALARAMDRVREMSIRVGLGAGRWRVVRHMLTESAVVAAAGSVGGLLLGLGTAHALVQRAGGVAHLDVSPDWRLGLAMLGAAVFAMIAVGLIPAWKIGRSDLALGTRDGGDRVTRGLHAARLRYLLVTFQIAGSCLLLVFTAQLARSLQRALEPDPGFEYANVAVLDPSLVSYSVDAQSAGAYWRSVRAAIEGLGETAEAAVVSYAPLNGGGGNNSRYRSTPQLRVSKIEVEPSFFSLMRIPILSGRVFDAHDDPETVVIVSRRVALEMYGAIDVVGRRFPKDEPRQAIVAVAGDAHLINPQATDAGEAYTPLKGDAIRASLLVRARMDPARLLAPLRQASRAADTRVVPDVRLMRDDRARLLQVPRVVSSVAGGVALLALALACLGVFGVVSHGARLRTREVGIRLALGAPRPSIVGTLLRRTIWASGTGLMLGLAGALALSRGLGGAPFFVQSRDPLPYVVAVLTLALAGTAAAVLPTLRSLRADPLRALRVD